jgi:hypothetical protein
MPCSRRLLLVVSLFVCLVSTMVAQTTESIYSKVWRSNSPGPELKKLIERHFESVSPHARPDLGGAIPGNLLLQQHLQRARSGRSRSPQSFAVQSQALQSNSALPGVALRPFLPGGSLPTSVVTGDFNNDGHMDFAVANGLTNDVWLYLGKGDGTFQDPRIVPLSKGLTPVSIAAADLRHNGKLDLIVGEFDSSSAGVLLGNGDGTFGYESIYSLPGPTESIVVDDFNHDGKLDVAALLVGVGGNPPPEIALLTGDGTGMLSSPVLSYNSGYVSAAWNIASGDVNGDGFPDLLITGPGYSDNSFIFLNQGDGTFKQGQKVVANGLYTAVLDGRLADVNGDGCLDAVVADAWSPVLIALGDCSGNFTTPTFLMMGDSNAAVRVMDVNGDGIPDIVTSSLPALDGALLGQVAGNTLSVALGTGKGNFSPPRNYVGTSQAYSIGIADFNGDGKPEFVTANNDSDTVTVYQNDGTGDFGFPQGVYAGVTGQGVDDAPFSSPSFLDINNDGKTDVFLLDEGYSGEYYATTFLNDGTGKFSSPILSDLGITIDANWIGDHRLGNFRDATHKDLIAIGNTISPQFILFAPGNNDGTFGKATLVTATGADGVLTIGDFNHDGKLDFVTIHGWDTHSLTTFLGNGSGNFHSLAPITFTDPATDTFSTQAVRVYTGEFNRDGKLDVLVFTTGNGYGTTRSTVWEFDGSGDGTFQTPRQIFTGFQPFVLADINGDGSPDIARYDGTAEGIPRFTNFVDQPDGSFVQSSLYNPYTGDPINIQPYVQNGDPLSSSLVTDLNGDGKLDEVAFQAVSPTVALTYAQVLIGNGDATFTPTYDIFPFYVDNQPIYAHDLDGDGIADMVSLIQATSSLQVYKGTHAPALQIELSDAVVQSSASCGWIYPNVVSSSDRTVTLFSSISGVLLPTTVTIPSGALSAKFCYTLGTAFDRRQVFDIGAQLNGDTATAYASATYVVGFTASIGAPATSTIYPGQSVGPMTLTLIPATGYASTVHLYCENLAPGDSCQFGSSTLSLSRSGPVSTTVTLVTGPNSGTYGLTPTFTVVAEDGNVLKRIAERIQLVGLNIYPLDLGFVDTASPGSASYRLGVTGIAPLTFSCLGLPAGAGCAFSDPVSNITNLTISIPAGVAAANYPIQINVNSESFQASTLIALGIISVAVQPASPSDQWSIPGTTRSLSLSVQASPNVPSVQIACSLDVPGSSCGSGSVSLNSGSPTNVTVGVTLPANALTGEHQLSLTSTFSGSTQTSTFPFTVADFSGSLSKSAITVANGGSATVTATLNGTSGFSGKISLSCGNAAVSCSFSPNPALLTGGTTQTITITMTAPTLTSAIRQRAVPPIYAPLLVGILAPVFFLRRVRKHRVLLWIGMFVLCSGFSACGGGAGSASNAGGGGGVQTTNYSVTVSANESSTGATRTLGTVTVTETH